MNWLFLAMATITEVVGTLSLKSSNGFTNFMPSIVVIICYGLALYSLSMAIRTIPVGVAYAIWCALGIVLVALISWIKNDQRLDLPAIIGMILIMLGILVMNIFSKTVTH